MRVAALLFCLALLPGCSTDPPAEPGLRTVQMPIGSIIFTLEVADTVPAQMKGLMQRDSMPEHHGMLFVFPDEREHQFHMKNTRIPLDILFLNRNGTIVSMATMKPYDLNKTPSNANAKYAIELNAGMIQKTQVKVGQSLTIPEDAREPKTSW